MNFETKLHVAKTMTSKAIIRQMAIAYPLFSHFSGLKMPKVNITKPKKEKSHDREILKAVASVKNLSANKRAIVNAITPQFIFMLKTG